MELPDVLLKAQEYYENTFRIYRICLTANKKKKSVVFKGNRTESHKHTLMIFKDGESFFGVKDPDKLFSKGNKRYCMECCTTITHDFVHRKKCPMRCPSCCRFGYEYPCKEIDKIFCSICNREFLNQECYDSHLEKRYARGRSICDIVKVCAKCGELDILDKQFGGEFHVCGKQYCYLCRAKAHLVGETCY